MNLEELISKYLDGDLSPAEDLRLRALIKEDPTAKAEFDAAVLVCIALKEDAKSIKTPDYVYHSVEDAILMEIMKAAPNEINRSNKNFVFGRRNSWALMLAFALIGGAFNYSRIGLEIIQPIATATNISKSSPAANSYDKIASASVKRVKSDKSRTANAFKANKKTGSFSGDDNLIENEIAANLPTVVIDNSVKIDLKNEDTDKKSNFAQIRVQAPSEFNAFSSYRSNSDLNGISLKVASGKPGVISDNPSNSGLRIADEFISNSEVQASSFFGSDFATWGFKVKQNSAMNTFSQAVSYSISEAGRIGLELGYSDVEYKDFGKVVINGRNRNKIEILNPSSNALVLKVEITKKTQIYWGGLFYENTFASGDIFSVTSRIGCGATNDGPLAFVRLYAKAKIYDGVYLTAGSDIRSFYARFGSTNASINAAASLVYGLQFKF